MPRLEKKMEELKSLLNTGEVDHEKLTSWSEEIDEIKTAWFELVGNTPETDAFGNVFISEVDYDTFTKIINPPK